jgi:hypothetical protein
MSVDEETLQAYVDGELSVEERSQVEALLAGDSVLRERVVQLQRVRLGLQRAFGKVLDEPVPERLTRAARESPAGSATVSAMADRRERSLSRPIIDPSRWRGGMALAASLAVGVVIGAAVFRSPPGELLELRQGELLAQGRLQAALETQLASEQPAAAPIQIGITFRDQAGNYCRSFTIRLQHALGGLACREQQGRWSVEATAPMSEADTGAGGLRMAAGALPPSVLAAIDSRRVGDSMDADSEKRAAAAGWP